MWREYLSKTLKCRRSAIWSCDVSLGVLRPGSLTKIVILVLNENASLDSF